MRLNGPRNAQRPWSFVAFPPIPSLLENPDVAREHEEKLLDEAIEQSFPASDPAALQKFN